MPEESSPVRVAPDFEALYPGASRAATECAMNLAKTGDMILARVADVLRPFRLSPAGGLILSMLTDSAEPIGPREIRDRLLVAGPTVTGLLDSLERQGLVRRVAHPGDRRRLLVEVTDQGRQITREFRPLVHSAERPWLECLGEPEQHQLIELLGQIQSHLRLEANGRQAPLRRRTAPTPWVSGRRQSELFRGSTTRNQSPY